jgi:hypothetical protein
VHRDERSQPRSRPQSMKRGGLRPPALRNRAFARQRLIIAVTVLTITVLVAGLALGYYATDSNLLVGYRPVQPIEFSHKLHAGDLGLDCRYCHSTAERSPFAAVPTSRVCMSCHSQVRTDSVKLLPLRATYAEQRSIAWVRVHNLPDFVYFDHSLHLAAGVGCSTCHGRVDQMVRVEQVESLSMGWCLDCHRNPAPYLRAPSEITNMRFVSNVSLASVSPDQLRTPSGRVLNPPLHCSGCHR